MSHDVTNRPQSGAAEEAIKTDNIFFLMNLVRTFSMKGVTRTEFALSRDCCAGPDPYIPFEKCLVVGRI